MERYAKLSWIGRYGAEQFYCTYADALPIVYQLVFNHNVSVTVQIWSL